MPYRKKGVINKLVGSQENIIEVPHGVDKLEVYITSGGGTLDIELYIEDEDGQPLFIHTKTATLEDPLLVDVPLIQFITKANAEVGNIVTRTLQGL